MTVDAGSNRCRSLAGQPRPRRISLLLAVSLAASTVMGFAHLAGCLSIGNPAAEDSRTADDIDGDGIPNEIDDDMDGDGLANKADPDGDSDGRFDRAMVLDFPFDHNSMIGPLLPPNHPPINFSGRVVMPDGHIDVTDIIRVNFAEHPLEFFEPQRQDQAAAQAD